MYKYVWKAGVCLWGWLVGFYFFSSCGYMLIGIWQSYKKTNQKTIKLNVENQRLPPLPLSIPVDNESCGSEWGDRCFLTNSRNLKHLGFLKTELLGKDSVNQSRARSSPSVRRGGHWLAFGKNWLFAARSQAEKWVWTTVRPKAYSGEGYLILFCPCVKKSISFQLWISRDWVSIAEM